MAPQKDKGAMESEAGLQTESPEALPGRNPENVVGYCPTGCQGQWLLTTHHPRESWEALGSLSDKAVRDICLVD